MASLHAIKIPKIRYFSAVDMEIGLVRIVKATYLWEIKNFSSSIQFGRIKVIESEIFKIKEERFYMQLSEGKLSDDVSIYLCRATSPKSDILIKCKCCILDDKGEEYNTKIFQHLYSSNSELGYGHQSYIKSSQLFSDREPLFPKGILTFRLEISAALDKESIFFLDNNSKELCHSKLIQDFSALMRDEKHFDLIISVKNKEIKVHKAFLFARSPVFASEIERQANDAEKKIVIDDFDFEIVKHMVNFIYTGEIPEVEVESLLSLLAISQRYDIKDLKTLCQERLLWNLRIENATSIFVTAGKYDTSDLENYCLEYFNKNVKYIFQTSDWLSYAFELPKPARLLLLRLAKSVPWKANRISTK